MGFTDISDKKLFFSIFSVSLNFAKGPELSKILPSLPNLPKTVTMCLQLTMQAVLPGTTLS